jgi:2-polyprenyl-3-methyl-5-hydroxy-6-metoxy-1,4-benzoquinol methylase
MRGDSLGLEAGRMEGKTLDNYPWVHERHRIFPEVFEDRNHRRVLDISAGIGMVAARIKSKYPCSLVCNEVDESCLRELKKLDIEVVSTDLDSLDRLPFADRSFDAIICLATLEHLVHLDHFAGELFRILAARGRLYLSVPNYASLYWMIPLIRGRTFHNPFGERSRYEFYAHIRYFTYQTLLEFMGHFGFQADTVYLPLPKGSSRFQKIRQRSRMMALVLQNGLRLLYHLSPRWHQEPVICFAKETTGRTIRKVIL